jgi:quinol monooxygenase YgiN
MLIFNKEFTADMIARRQFIIWLGSLSLSPRLIFAKQQGDNAMYGLIGQILCVEGKRAELATILLNGIADMPGCLSYVIAEDKSKQNALWVSEVWTDETHHKASINLPSVQAAIKLGRPLITGFGERFETLPIGGKGL